MTTVAVEHFTDPFSPWCWAAQPTLRRLRYEFPDARWVPRMTVLLPGDPAGPSPDGDEDSGDRRTRWAEAAGRTGMPVADEPWPDGVPTSRPACAAVAFVRETSPDRAVPVLRGFRVAAFAEGRAVDDEEAVAALAGSVDGVDGEAVGRALADGRAEGALETDLQRAVEVAGELDDVEVRGDVSVRPAGPRLEGGSGSAVPAEEPPDHGGERDGDAKPEGPPMVAPSTLRVEAGSVAVVDAGLPFGRLASAFGRSVPRTGIDAGDKYATGRMAMHVPREVAESLSGRDFREEVRPYLAHFGTVYLPEVVAGTGLSARTCASALDSLVDRGEAMHVGPSGWRTVDDPGGRQEEP